MIVALAETVSATHIITRNLSDFKKSPIRAISPEAFNRIANRST